MRIEKTALATAAVILMSWLLAVPAHAGSFSGLKSKTLVNVEGAVQKVGFRGRRGFHHRRFRHHGFRGRRFGFRRHGFGYKRFGFRHRGFHHRRFHHRRFGHRRFHVGRRFHGGFRSVFRSGR